MQIVLKDVCFPQVVLQRARDRGLTSSHVRLGEEANTLVIMRPGIDAASLSVVMELGQIQNEVL